MKHIVKTEADWLELRKQYITASEAAVLVGADPYSSPGKLREPSTFTGNAYTRVGQILEPVVVNITNDVLKLEGDSRFVLFETAEGYKEFYTKGYLGATPDAHADHKVLLECKTTQPKHFLKYGSVPPSKYLVQLLTQMICTDLEEGYLSIMSTDLTQRSQTLDWPIAVFKIWKCGATCAIIESQAEKFSTSEKFRVDSKIKQRVKVLLSLCWEKVI